MSKLRYVLITCGVCSVLACSTLAQDAPVPAKPRHVILMIGDGMGFNQVVAGSEYAYGEPDGASYQKFDHAAVATYSVEGSYDPAKIKASFEYAKEGATDSAAAATALATGVSTYDSAIGVGPDKQPLRNATETAESAGKSTGVVSSVQFAHATPASFVAHKEGRGEYAAIAREMIEESSVDVVMGAGHPWFDVSGKSVFQVDEQGAIITPLKYDYVGGVDTWLNALTGLAGADADNDGVPDPWTVVQSRAQFQALASGDTPKRVLGVAPVNTSLQVERAGAEAPEPYATPRTETVPTLGEMASAALNVLDNDPDGFFLMIEGGAIDWASHENHMGRMIEEQVEFNEAVDSVIAWVEQESSWDDTLLIVTADHETGYLTGPDDATKWTAVVGKGKGQTPGHAWHSDGHTNTLVPLYVKGAGAADLLALARQNDALRGSYLHNTEIGQFVLAILE